MDVSHQEKVGKTWPQYLAVLTALFTLFNSGLHFGWPSPSIPKILSDEYVFNVTEEEASYIVTIGPLGNVVGSILYPAIIDHIGRKIPILLIALPQIVSMTMIFLSNYSMVLLYIARFVGGIAEGACFTIVPLYIGEITEPKVRGMLGSSFSFIYILGVVVMNAVGSYVTIQTAALIFVWLPVLFLLMFFPMPESPYYFLMKSNTEGAEKSLQKLRGKNDVTEELKTLTQDVKRQLAESGKYRDLFTIKSNRAACIVMIGLRMIHQLAGASALLMYMQVLLQKSSSFLPKHIASHVVFVVMLAFHLIAIAVVDKVGRKPLLLISCLGCAASLFFEAIYLTIKDFSDVDVSHVNYLPIVGIIVFFIVFTLGHGNVISLMSGEMFSSSIKAKAICLLNILFSIFIAVATKFYQYTADKFGLCVPFYVFGVMQIFGAAFCIWYVPETRGKSLEEIQQELKKRRKSHD